MKVHGKVTRVVEDEGKVFFRPIDQAIYSKLALAQITASGEIVVPAGDTKHEVGADADFEVLGQDDIKEDEAAADDTKEVPPQGDVEPKAG